MRRSFYILLFTLSCQISLACGPFDRLYSPEQYHTFRICGNNMNGLNNPQNDLQPQAQIAIEKNCQYWSEITSTDIPITDIKEVVYDWNYEQLSRLHACACDSGHLQGNNAFAKWLVKHNDTEVTSYLLLAKRCEMVRSQQNSEWYYPVEGDNESITLAELCTQAKRYHSKRLLDRYTLQMMRCFISMRQYSDCLNLWIDKKHVFRQNIIFSMAKGYAAGAFYHVGEKEIAKRMFIEVGDIYSYLFCQQMEGKPYSNLNLLSLLCNNNIDDNRILPLMQYIVHTNEGLKESYDYSALNELALKSLPEVSSKNKAAWHYLASYTYDKQGNSHAALKHIKQASRYATNHDLKDAIRVFRIYLTVKQTQKYDMEFESRSNVCEEEYIEMIRLKTSVLLACAIKIGAILGGAPAEDADNLYKFGEQVGLAFQLQDDYLDVYGDPAVFGKAIGGDILCNKKTYMLINAFNRADEAQRKELKRWVTAEEFDPEEKIAAVTSIYDKLGIGRLAEEKIDHYFRQSRKYLAAVNVPDERKRVLEDYTDKMMKRKY